MTKKTEQGDPSSMRPIRKKDLLFKAMLKVRSVHLAILYAYLPRT